ncbi:rhamnan synthesis F family protein [Microbacterium dextranolyticum]|uniref:rhamnan synthesis F family protein n=1 Tax=Microbacterium dextranolyticum TaxID=36806 RepID=UPI001957D05B|nr:rhamnan synthesis F family protein [Microbacterium dextranolyticum]MBM7463755.1 rhamnosyltransferase [Microbacterium dextranolyticum]
MTKSEPGAQSASAQVFPEGGRRVVFYMIYDPRGEIDDYIPYKLERLRPHADHIFAVINGALSESGRARLEPLTDTILVRENVGFDVWAYKAALEEFGAEQLAEYDELILMNYTWFGPVRPFEPLFSRMEARPLHFWGMTDHDEIVPNPFTKEGILHRHLQSHWIAVRKSMFTTRYWRDYWAHMPMIDTYTDSIVRHESRFTHHFEELGFEWDAAFPVVDFPGQHPALVNADLLLDAGCPALKRRAFFHYPPYLDQHAVIGRWTLERAAHYGYPLSMLFQNLVRNSKPRELYTDASMHEILPEVDVAYDPGHPLSIAAVVHIFYEDMTDELVERLLYLPVPFDLFVTTTSEAKATSIRESIARREDPKINFVDVRVLPSNRGRDLSAFFIGSKDVLEPGRYDLVVKIHSKKTVQGSFNSGRYFKLQQLGNVLSSPGYVANAIALFQKEEGLGLVFPPMIHIGFPTMGRGWYANRQPAEKLAKELGIRVPFDEISPLAPYGCMWIARPEALRLLVEHEWRYKDYAPPEKHFDGSLAHVQERLIAYAAAEVGYHTRTIANAEHASISHTALEFKLDQMGATMPGYAIDQIQFLHRAGWLGHGGIVALTRVYLKLNHPRVAGLLRPLDRPARYVHHQLWKVRHPETWKRNNPVEVESDIAEGELRSSE